MRTLTLAVAGDGPANRQQIHDALNDWLGFGPEDEQGYFDPKEVEYDKINLLLPLSDEHFTAGVDAFFDWSSRADLDFVGVFDEHEMARSRRLKFAKAQAKDLIPAEDILTAMIERAAERADDGDVHVLVFQEDDGSDKLADRAAEIAFEHDLSVLNLSFALAPLAPPAPARTTEPIEADEAEQQAAEPSEQATAPEPENLAAITLTDQYIARVDLDFPLAGEPKDVAQYAFGVLGKLVCYHNALDTAQRAAHQQQGSGEMSPLTADLLRATVAFQRLLEHDGPIHLSAPEVPGEPIASAESVEKPAKTRKAWRDEKSGLWKPVGRGRPRKDVQVRVEHFDEATGTWHPAQA